MERSLGVQVSEGLGTEVPQRGPGAEPRWGLGAELPEATFKVQIYKA